MKKEWTIERNSFGAIVLGHNKLKQFCTGIIYKYKDGTIHSFTGKGRILNYEIKICPYCDTTIPEEILFQFHLIDP